MRPRFRAKLARWAAAVRVKMGWRRLQRVKETLAPGGLGSAALWREVRPPRWWMVEVLFCKPASVAVCALASLLCCALAPAFLVHFAEPALCGFCGEQAADLDCHLHFRCADARVARASAAWAPHARWLLEQSAGDDGWDGMTAGSRQRLALLLRGGKDRNRGWGLKEWRAKMAEWWMECWGGLMAEWVAETAAGRAEAARQARAAARAKRREAAGRDDAAAGAEAEAEVEVELAAWDEEGGS